MKKSFPTWLWAALLVPYLVIIAGLSIGSNNPRSRDGEFVVVLCFGVAALSQLLGLIVAICFLMTRQYRTLKNVVTTLFVGSIYALLSMVALSLGGLR